MKTLLLPYADIRPIKLPPRLRLALAALACAAAGIGLPLSAAHAECAAAGGPAGAAGTSALYGTLSNTVSAEPLSVDITAKAIGGICSWVYEVKVLTVQGSVAILDFDLVDLDLRHVEGPAEDPEVARLKSRLGDGDKVPDGAGGDAADSASGSESGRDSNSDSGSGGEGGGSDGSGSGGSGSGSGGSGSGGSGGGEGGSDGGGEGGSDGGSEGGSDD
ncbi:MAG: hypothetical protein HYU58_02120 [Proteobacteria bacterium]|nr:hypothetical protein [Pseudomonadota bacterium]